MKRRQFITLLGGAAAWPLVARAQQRERMRSVGVLLNLAADDPMGQARVAAFVQGLQAAGWSDGRNVRIDTRWAAADPGNYRKYAAELIALGPDVILASTTAAVVQLQQASRAVPIVFVSAIDPVGSGLITSMARPGGEPVRDEPSGAARRVGGPAQAARGLPLPLFCQCGRPDLLRVRSAGRISPRRRLRRSHPQGREAG
jgi:ABC transporter substrate binding protein